MFAFLLLSPPALSLAKGDSVVNVLALLASFVIIRYTISRSLMGFSDMLLDQETVPAARRLDMPRFFLPVVLLPLVLMAGACCTAPEVSVQEPLADTLPMDPSAAEPPVVFEMPELVCVAEAEGIAFVPDLPIDVLYFRDVWFWKIRGTWYWSKTYMGMLYELSIDQVPKDLRKFGDTYRAELPDCREFTYEDWHRRVRQR
ncbi:MAG: hypothetical protein P1S46_06670 [bacterium]|nr:hypothetical protein [bacterium]MDT8396693.1 hypothetical protein [bacterium]